MNPISGILNNKGYTTERFLRPGDFNNVWDWEYHRIVDVIRGGKGFNVKTEGELEAAFTEALDSKELAVINIHLGANDVSPALVRMTKALSERI